MPVPMENLVLNPSFEAGMSGWAFDHAMPSDQYGAHDGDNACWIYTYQSYLGGPKKTGYIVQDIAVSPGDIVRIRAWVREQSPGGTSISCSFRNPSGAAWRELERVSSAPDWTLIAHDAIARGDRIALKFELTDYASAPLLSSWLVDDVEVIVVPITKTIRDALISDLQQISTANGYGTDLVEVGTEPKPMSEARPPAVYLVPGQGGTAELETLSNMQGAAIQRITLDLLVRSATPHDDAVVLLDDVRNAIERSDGATLAVNGVESVQVVEWSEVMTSEDVGNAWGLVNVTVEVAYVYSRGSA